jgi:hypothetical protein
MRPRIGVVKFHISRIWQEFLSPAVSNHAQAKVSGGYFHHQEEHRDNSEADDVQLQERFLSLCEQITGVSFP